MLGIDARNMRSVLVGVAEEKAFRYGTSCSIVIVGTVTNVRKFAGLMCSKMIVHMFELFLKVFIRWNDRIVICSNYFIAYFPNLT